MRAGCAAALTFAAAGCALISTGAYVNQPASEPEAKGPGTTIATMAVPWHLDFQCNGRTEPCPTPEQAAACRRWLYYGGEGDPCADIPRDADFVGLTLSGGGTRSAVLSAAIMFEMQRLGILRSIDVISSVSGGSLTAALYAASCDAPQDCQLNVSEGDRIYWRERDVFLKLRHNFMGDWALSLFANPVNVARYMVTYFDRNDVMADALADRLYTRSTGFFSSNDGLTFAQLNPMRPNLILGATDVTTSSEQYGLPGRCFQFTLEHFQGPGRNRIEGERNINSDLDGYPVAYAVMASNAFPGLFQYENLRDFAPQSDGRTRYLHLADGGIRDQVALVPINSILKGMLSPTGTLADSCDVSRGEDDRNELTIIDGSRRITIFVVDAANPPRGGDEFDPDARFGFLDYLPLGKALDAVDTIIDDQRALRGAEFVETRAKLTRALGGDPRCCRVVVFTVHNYLKRLGPRTRPEVYNYAIEQLDPTLYMKITREMPIGLNVNQGDLCALRQTARLLVGAMSKELCRDGRVLDTGIACDPAQVRPASEEYSCAPPS
jgi:predicted acylesterase/phospholipase RssA